MAKTDITKLGTDVAWQDVTRGNTVEIGRAHV